MLDTRRLHGGRIEHLVVRRCLGLLGLRLLWSRWPSDLRLVEQRILVLDRWLYDDARLRGSIFAVVELFAIHVVVHLLEGSRLFNLVEVNHKAVISVMQVLDTLATEDRRMVAAVEVLDPLVVHLTQVGFELLGVLFVVDVEISLQALFKIH